MDNKLFDLVAEQCPKFTKHIAEGFAVSQISMIEQYIDQLFRQVAVNFPPNLKYLGPQRVSPLEEFNIISNMKRGGKRVFDVARSDVYLMSYIFELDGKVLPKPVYLYLPYVSRGGMITIKNAKFAIVPVMADVGLSVRNDSIFIIMNRAKLTFNKTVEHIVVDGVRESTYVVWSQVYNITTRNIVSSLGHYLFCKFGVIDSFKRMGADVIVVGRDKIDSDQFPTEQYVVCTSAGARQGKLKRRSGTDVAIIIPRNQFSNSVKSLVGSFFYIADQWPERIRPDDFDGIRLWRVLLGKVLFGSLDSESKNLTQINTHIASVDGYVDGMVRNWLRDGGYGEVNDIYDLFQLVIEVFPSLVVKTSANIASLYGKRLVVNRYVIENIINGITNVLFSVQKQMNTKGVLREKDMENFFRKNLPYNLILRINSGHSEVKSVSTASDCLLHKVTSVVIMQTETTSGSSNATFDETKVLDASILEVCAIANLPDADPTGRSRLNGCANIDLEGNIHRNPALADIIAEVESKIKR